MEKLIKNIMTESKRVKLMLSFKISVCGLFQSNLKLLNVKFCCWHVCFKTAFFCIIPTWFENQKKGNVQKHIFTIEMKVPKAF